MFQKRQENNKKKKEKNKNKIIKLKNNKIFFLFFNKLILKLNIFSFYQLITSNYILIY